MIPSCFSHPNTLSNTSHHQTPQSLITSLYLTHLCDSPTHLTLTWSKTLFTHSVTLFASDSLFSVTISLYPSSPFSFFRNKSVGSKSIYLTRHHYQKIKVYWDFTRAEFTHNSAEPNSCFHIAIICNARLEFFLGDLPTELTRQTSLIASRVVAEPTLLSRREHVFGRNTTYVSRVEFLGSKHEIGIELCNNIGALIVKVDGKVSLTVKRLAWKFRGNERIFIGGMEVEFFWDVFNWFNNSKGNGNSNNSNVHGVFIFQVGDGGGVWPEFVGLEKRLMRKSNLLGESQALKPAAMTSLPRTSSYSSVLQWAEESSDCGRSSCSSSTTTRSSCGSSNNNGGFSLLLYAWSRD
ncbi:uncharacterized protein LOC126675138 [Mercurialis annua]|uniref:uncharacterized protein LOC126675138 n=1 Tax=Mercurialis annua TaxID=3986 RepID=UPI00215EEFA1|nr:uncharacterized protein LOC126675138 [Mercurialis annua]